MDMISSFLLWSLIVFGATNGIVVSALLKPFRDWLNFSEFHKDANGNITGGTPRKFKFFGKLVICPMCMGFWIGGLAGLLLYSPCATLNPDANLIVIFLGDAFLGSIMAWIYYLGLANIQFKH